MDQVSTKQLQVQRPFLERVFREPKFWIVLIFLAWASSFFWLGADAFLPIVPVIGWMNGLDFLFHNFFVTLDKLLFNSLGTWFPVVIDIVFFIFIGFVYKMPKKFLYPLGFFFILILLLSLVGCSQMDYDYLKNGSW
jgi:hypothetical protein